MSTTTRSQARRSKQGSAAATASSTALAMSAVRLTEETEDDAFDDEASMAFCPSSEMVLVSDVDSVIKRFLAAGDMKSAEYWVDRKYAEATATAKVDSAPFLRMADFVQELTSCGCADRVATFIHFHSLHTRHLFFAYFYFNAQALRQLWPAITQAPVGHLVQVQGVELQNAQTTWTNEGCGNRLNSISPADAAELDRRTSELRLESGLLFLLGRAFLHMENRDAAAACLSKAYFTDPTCLQAEQLLRRFNLVAKGFANTFEKMRKMRAEGNEKTNSLDPREQVLLAHRLFAKGDSFSASRITSALIQQFGLYQDALLVHIASLVQQRDSEKLFLLAHRLVDAQPDSEVSWYAVALYYFVCSNNQAAKSFMNKATAINESFGEGWLAFGHILAADSEHEQAMNCYLKAARVQERHFEPLLYIAMGHCYTNNVKLACDFLTDAAKRAPDSPVVVHEQGALAYTRKDFQEAESLFERALRLVVDVPATEDKPCVQLLIRPIDMFWEPLLNNLGHVARRRGRFKDAIQYHLKALLMSPRKVSTLSALGMCYACLGDSTKASQYFHHALAIRPFNVIVRSALDKMVLMCVSNEQRSAMEQHLAAIPERHIRNPVQDLRIEQQRVANLRAELDECDKDVEKINRDVCSRKIRQSGRQRRSVTNEKNKTRESDADEDQANPNSMETDLI